MSRTCNACHCDCHCDSEMHVPSNELDNGGTCTCDKCDCIGYKEETQYD